ncbi:hypothetical protein MXB_5070 [Myxobolus squamalis]|nr:hypothetical protein MXB_5070 [Myxobolus squamalis]
MIGLSTLISLFPSVALLYVVFCTAVVIKLLVINRPDCMRKESRMIDLATFQLPI